MSNDRAFNITASCAKTLSNRHQIDKIVECIPEEHRDLIEQSIMESINRGEYNCKCYPQLFEGEIRNSKRIVNSIQSWLFSLGYTVEFSKRAPDDERVVIFIGWM